MKSILGIFVLVILSNLSFGQEVNKIVTIYNSDSTFVGTGVMQNGLMEGFWKFENPKTKQFIQSIFFKNGQREGKSISYYPNRNKNVEAEYKGNKLNGAFIEYDVTGAIKLELIFKDSIPVGPYKEYYGRAENPDFFNPKQIKKEGNFVNGKKDGRWITYYNSGQLAIVENYKNGILEGQYMEYNVDGQLIVEVMYQDNFPNGPFRRYSIANILGEQGEFNKGRKTGKWIAYFPGTRIIESEKSYDANGSKMGEWKFYYENKRLARVEKYENSVPVGTWEEFFSNNNLAKRKTYELGMPVGEYLEYHSNGKISVTGKYENGMKVALWKNYYPDGTLFSIGEYKNDLKTGLWKYFNKISILVAEGEYTLGSENGQWFYYYDGGQLKSVGSYFLGFEDGIWGLFYDNKQLTQEETWSNGRLMNVGEYYSYDGTQILDKGTLKDGEGTRITYYITGKKESEGQYKSGKADGTWSYYHENGRKASEGKMIEGKKEGLWKYFNTSGRLEQIITFQADEIVPEKDPEPLIQFNPFD